MEARERHDAALETVTEEYRNAGYEVIPTPSPAHLPPALYRHRPDLLAVRGDEHVVVEVTVGGESGGPRLGALAEAVASLPGWHFRLVVLPRGELWEHGAAAEPSEADIEASLQDADALAETRPVAALLLAWGATEAALRTSASRLGVSAAPDGASVVLGRLAYEGILDGADYDTLRSARLLRNAAAHGYRAEIRRHHVAALVEATRRLLSEPDLA